MARQLTGEVHTPPFSINPRWHCFHRGGPFSSSLQDPYQHETIPFTCKNKLSQIQMQRDPAFKKPHFRNECKPVLYT